MPHAAANSWPLLILSGASETHNAGKDAFQEVDAVTMLKPLTKFAARPPSPDLIPKFIKDAYRSAMFGKPGPAFVDLPADLILGTYDIEPLRLKPYREAPKSMAPDAAVRKIAEAIKSAKAPLVVFGKGAAYGRAEGQVRALIDR